jgi:hypothetical protein
MKQTKKTFPMAGGREIEKSGEFDLLREEIHNLFVA